MSRDSLPRVLVVDDDEVVRRALRSVMEVEGLEVVGEASDGVEAVSMAVDLSPEIIVLDFVLPLQNGEETAAQIRSLELEASIVAFSASLEVKPAWADAFVAKEELDQLVGLVHELARASGGVLGESDTAVTRMKAYLRLFQTPRLWRGWPFLQLERRQEKRSQSPVCMLVSNELNEVEPTIYVADTWPLAEDYVPRRDRSLRYATFAQVADAGWRPSAGIRYLGPD